jgi:hypothetical protein
VRFLVLEHFSAQDIDALREAAGDELELDVMPYDLLRSEALRILPTEVGTGLEAFARPELEGARRRYGGLLREMLEDRFSRAPFDALVSPSDSFFYVRAAPAAAHALGVPFLVAQKETTIPEHSMRNDGEMLHRLAPPLADLMTVCSERHKRYWVNAGGAEDRIVVTGQPRFDFYDRRARTPGVTPPARNGHTALFLSYFLDGYYPGDSQSSGGWSALHGQTEQGLCELARRGWRVLIKPHPQQDVQSLRALQQRAGDLWGGRISLVDAAADVRELILTVDVTVGFQSTAMLEAMLVGRPVVYTGWDETAAAFGDELIPFHRWEREITVVRSAQELPDAVATASGATCSSGALRRRRELAERYLGPLDGRAAARTIAALCEEAERWATRRGAGERELRERLARRRPPLRIARRARAWTRAYRPRVGAMLGR